MKQETMRCNIIAQRIALQEHLIERAEDINKEIDEWINDEDKIKTLDKATVDTMMDTWLAEFQIVMPSQFFKDHPTNDTELVCSIQTEKEFMLSTLHMFGLPYGYMEGNGHFPNWGKEQKKKKIKNPKKQKQNVALAKLKKRQGRPNKDEEEAKPTHFDITIFHKSFKRFVACNGEVRS